jgi:hypothetical protein
MLGWHDGIAFWGCCFELGYKIVMSPKIDFCWICIFLEVCWNLADFQRFPWGPIFDGLPSFFSCRVKYSQISMVSRWLGNARKMVEYTHYFGTSTNFSKYLEGYMSNVIIHVNGQYLCIIVHSHCIFSPTEWFESNQQTKVSQTWLKIERMISWNINSVISYLRSFA